MEENYSRGKRFGDKFWKSTNKLSENELLAYENGLLLCLEKIEWLLARASVTGPDNTPGRAPERVRPVLTAFTAYCFGS
ncbi:hypothetical protein QL285_058142 [Trifolium repens]|nr:hypothetical protein QL285_058142 [Trifolium repens]